MKSENQKAKILYIAQYLFRYSDVEHPVSTPDIIAYLDKQGIKAERKSIYDDVRVLTDFGLDIIKVDGARGGYYLGSRDFELAEVKILVDLVQSSKFITEKKSGELIRKLETLVSNQEAKQLQRQVIVTDRNKTVNEKIYYAVDTIYTAMAENHRICFQYFEWNEKKEPVLRHDGRFYEVSPWLLTWNNEKYYLVAFDEKDRKIKHYRVDKMLELSVTDEPRNGKEEYQKIDIASLTKQTFEMFAGDVRTVRIAIRKSLAGVMLDKFGMDVTMRPLDEDTLFLHADVAISNQFFGWLAGLGDDVKLVGPTDVALRYKEFLERILAHHDWPKEEE